MEISEKDKARFWKKVQRSESCWLWIAGHFSRGYGAFQIHGKAHCAHRISWIIANGPIPDGMVIMHSCDNPPCVNPDHLVLGTQLDNIKDRDNKNRWRGSGRRGQDMPTAKLSDAEVIEIRVRYAAGFVMQKNLAAEYGISKTQMHSIVHRKQWTHI